MWTVRHHARRLVLTVALVVATGSGAALTHPPAASAAGTGQAFYGDVTGDGHPDRITLGVAVTGGCGVNVFPGDGTGRYGSATLHPYRVPGDPNSDFCPDTGTALDIGGDGVVELVVGWCCGPAVDYGLLILRNFQPAGTLPGLWETDHIEVAEFNGDDLPDLYLSTYFGGFTTLLNTPAGTLVPGPVTYACADPRYLLADFQGNGRQDVVINCVDHPNDGDVVVLLDNGTRVPLRDGEPQESYSLQVLDVNADGRLDVRTTSERTGTTVVHLGRGDGTFATVPIANDDLAHAYRHTPKVIKVRDNDLASGAAKLTVTSPPKYGYLTNVDSRYEVQYVRTASHRLADTFVYRLTEAGLSDTATVTVKMKD
ncbi:hypothetical protein BDK92_4819 [Micromonospora pisi]|uniref:VCBS repeat protein n=1 Tax=Micromonospora pisi TaxID=589240 RepID=A0A495JN58_9ACTN|nr:hypothetical protein [Micromonospora pisi]RKR90446.1 hypothetical protein BDK92_4819 [Micromonospora pisi]